MRPIAWLIVIGLLGSARARAQDRPDPPGEAELKQLVDDYIGLYRKETLPRWRELFLPSFTVASTTDSGTARIRTLDEFYAAQERGFAASREMRETLENLTIERRGRLASIWADFVFVQDGQSSRGRLVLLAIADRSRWRFHSLMFSYWQGAGNRR